MGAQQAEDAEAEERRRHGHGADPAGLQAKVHVGEADDEADGEADEEAAEGEGLAGDRGVGVLRFARGCGILGKERVAVFVVVQVLGGRHG